MNAVVQVRNLGKSYGNFRALDDVSFTISRGSIVGLVGPNGAGKSTTLKAILGLTDFEGELEVLGRDPREGRHHVMEKVCFIADVGVLPRWLRVSEAIDYIAGVHPRFNREKAEALLAETCINPRQHIKQLSKGMVTQLHLSLVLAINVELLVLDEPTLGLDILYQKAFFDRLLNDYFDNDTSILISTHQIEEVKSILSHLLFIDNGKLVLDTSMEDLASKYCEVLVRAEHEQRAMRLQPLHVRDFLGRKSMIFEDRNREVLATLGEIQVPAVADLFVAKMKRSI